MSKKKLSANAQHAHQHAIHRAEIDDLRKENSELRKDNEDYRVAFRLYDNATVALTKAWRVAHPGNDRVLPDTAKMCEWAAAEIERVHSPAVVVDQLKAAAENVVRALKNLETATDSLGDTVAEEQRLVEDTLYKLLDARMPRGVAAMRENPAVTCVTFFKPSDAERRILSEFAVGIIERLIEVEDKLEATA